MSGHQRMHIQFLIQHHSSKQLVEIIRQLREDGELVLARGLMRGV